jgi:hypothetical protein
MNVEPSRPMTTPKPGTSLSQTINCALEAGRGDAVERLLGELDLHRRQGGDRPDRPVSSHQLVSHKRTTTR